MKSKHHWSATMKFPAVWKRPLAFILDVLIIAIAQFVVNFAIIYAYLASGGEDMRLIVLIVQCLNLVLLSAYFIAFECSRLQATPGKLLLKIKVTDLSGRRISGWRSAGRFFARSLAALPLMIGYLMIPFTKKRQGLHDMIASCLVVDRAAEFVREDTQVVAATAAVTVRDPNLA
jgi:uncharacterized RDD family membrane protein YckC